MLLDNGTGKSTGQLQCETVAVPGRSAEENGQCPQPDQACNMQFEPFGLIFFLKKNTYFLKSKYF